VAIVICWYKTIRALTPTSHRDTTGTLQDIPVAFRGTEHGDVCLAVAVIVSGHNLIRTDSPTLDSHPACAVDDIPVAFRRTEDRNVRLAITVIISGNEDVSERACAPTDCLGRVGHASPDSPNACVWIPGGEVRHTV